MPSTSLWRTTNWPAVATGCFEARAANRPGNPQPRTPPSPNGVIDGQKIWYEYARQTRHREWYEGTQSNPQLVATVLPDGTTRYTRYVRNDWGLPTQVTTTYSSGGGVSTRTTTYGYDTTGKKLMSVTGPDGQLRVSYTYDTQFPTLIKTITRYHAAGQGYTCQFAGKTGQGVAGQNWPLLR